MRNHLLLASLVATLATGCTAYQQRLAFTGAGIAVSGLIACDNRETVHVSDGGRWDRITPNNTNNAHEYEINPLLGHTPSVPDLDTAATAAAGLTMLVATSDSLPTWSKIAYLAIVGVSEVAAVAGNAKHAPGICGM